MIERIEQISGEGNIFQCREELNLLRKSFRVMRKLAHDMTPFTERKTPHWVDEEFERRMTDG